MEKCYHIDNNKILQTQYSIIILNCPLNINKFIQQLIKSANEIIVADGGANRCKDLNIIPHKIVGDFDSISQDTMSYFENKCEIITKGD